MSEQNGYHPRGYTSSKRRQSRDGNDGGPWKAMKRLRVADQETPMASAGVVQEHTFHHIQHAHYNQQDHNDQQESGQKTMLEGWGPYPTLPYQQPSAAKSEDTDYQCVNHILGALHLERRQREQVVHHQTTESSPSEPVSYFHTPVYNSTRSYEHSYQTPPPKPGKRKVVQLHTNSKLA